jgi:phosphoserine phosphatase
MQSLVLVSPAGPDPLAAARAALKDAWTPVAERWIEPGEALHLEGPAPLPEGLSERLAPFPLDWSTRPPKPARLLIADMDSTIIGCECLDELADFAGRKAEVAAITERAMAGELDFEGALTARVAMLKGLGLDALEACRRERVRLNPGARTMVATMRAHGAHAALVSGGFTPFTGPVAAEAGFHEHRANTLLDDGARLTGAVGRPILGREAKLAALVELADARGLSPDAAMAIGDGANDLAMIEAAGLGVAYRAKPVVAARAAARIDHGTLESALFFQGFGRDAFVTD